MARRPQAPLPTENPWDSPVLRKHVKELGFEGRRDYLFWRQHMGLGEGPATTSNQRSHERELRREHLAKEAEARADSERLMRSPAVFLQKAVMGELPDEGGLRRAWRSVQRIIRQARIKEEQREDFWRYLQHIQKVSELIFAEATLPGGVNEFYAKGLVHLFERRGQWRRPIEDWKPRRHNVRFQFGHLARHLMADYPVPDFLDAAWLRTDTGAYHYRNWFIHIGAGRNIRTAKTPYPMTKMIAHHFVEAPRECSIEAALMRADILALGGRPELATSLMATRLGRDVEWDLDKRAFWLSVYRFFIANPMLDLRHVGPIIDYLHAQKFEAGAVHTPAGWIHRPEPLQPNLSMSRRTPETLLRQVEGWHRALRTEQRQRSSLRGEQLTWPGSGRPTYAETLGPRDEPHKQTVWTVREICTWDALKDEGEAMRHCILSYAGSCASGAYSVWSMTRKFGAAPEKRALTIAVTGIGEVVEARGLANRWATPEEWEALQRWMGHAKLRAGPYLMRMA